MGPTVTEDRPRGPGQCFTMYSIIPPRELCFRSRVLMVIDDIRDLLAAPRPVVSEPFLERVDATLTDGYAHALQLEAERWRIERRIAEVLAGVPEETVAREAPELAALMERLRTANEDIAALRTLLVSLRERRSELSKAA
jgi:hypothetical protein